MNPATFTKSSRWKSAREHRQRWSLNACRKREHNRIERAVAPFEEITPLKLPKLPRIKADLKIRITRRDGGTVNFTLHEFYGKLVGSGVNMSPKQFGRKLGEMFSLWITK